MKKLIALTIMMTSFSGCAMYPPYRVWEQGQNGEAELAHAKYSKLVAVETAHAKMSSAEFEAKAEVIRAGGVAKANKIIGDSLKQNEDYLKYLWINQLENTQNEKIYIPTEANLPILEARSPR
jgi:hypothetical protein